MAGHLFITLLVLSTFLSGCLGKLLEEQRAEVQRQQEDLERLRQETAALYQRRQKEQQEQEACNQAFYKYQAARKTENLQDAIMHYRQGLQLCPNDDVAHNELGQIYLQQGQLAETITEFTEALKITPNFSLAPLNSRFAQEKN